MKGSQDFQKFQKLVTLKISGYTVRTLTFVVMHTVVAYRGLFITFVVLIVQAKRQRRDLVSSSTQGRAGSWKQHELH